MTVRRLQPVWRFSRNEHSGEPGAVHSYDAAADQYVYVWKTDKMWAGTCRRVLLKFNEGSAVRTADFNLAK